MPFVVAKNGAAVRAPEGNYPWGPNHFQPASTLTADERAKFDVFEIAESARPAFNPALQKLQDNIVEVSPGKWEQSWTVVPLSPDELTARTQEQDARKSERVSNIDALQFYVSFNHENRIRALEGKAAITAAQFRNALKAQL